MVTGMDAEAPPVADTARQPWRRRRLDASDSEAARR